jgi:hypothetical protein
MKLLAFERKNVHAILEAFAPYETSDGLAPRVGEVDYVHAFELIADAGTDRARLGVRAALWFTLLAPLWMGIGLGSMASLSIDKRAAIIDRMLASNVFLVRELALLLKISAAFALMGTGSVRARSNYDRRRVELPDVSSTAEPTAESIAARPKSPRALPVVTHTSRGL